MIAHAEIVKRPIIIYWSYTWMDALMNEKGQFIMLVANELNTFSSLNKICSK